MLSVAVLLSLMKKSGVFSAVSIEQSFSGTTLGPPFWPSSEPSAPRAMQPHLLQFHAWSFS